MVNFMKSKKTTCENRRRKSHTRKQIARRLSSYTTAAGLGAFACGVPAQAAIVHKDLADLSVTEGGSYYVDMNGDEVLDFRLWGNTAGYAPARMRFQGVYPSLELTNTAKGSAYYLRSFELDDMIGPGAEPTDNGSGQRYGIVSANYGNFGLTDTENFPQFAGIQLDIAGSTHYAWVRMQTEPVSLSGAPVPPLTATVFEWAYETNPNTAIKAGDKGSWPGDFNNDGNVDGTDLSQWRDDFGVNADSDADGDGDSDGQDFLVWQRNHGHSGTLASVPEPTSLALLAAGGGALALGLRRNR
jgi:PEP-CTERM motif-containing protein